MKQIVYKRTAAASNPSAVSSALADAEEKESEMCTIISGAVTRILVHKCENSHKWWSHNLKDQSYRGHYKNYKLFSKLFE